MSSKQLHQLFQNASKSGLSVQSVDLLIQNLDGTAGLGCVGAQADDLNTDDVTLLSVILDQSGSMSGLQDDVIEAFNQMTRALYDSKARDSILMSAWTFADKPNLLFGYTPIDQVQDLTRQVYQPNGATALYDATLNAFTGLVGYGQNLRNSGIRTRCIAVVISDGADNVSARTAAAVQTVAQDLLKQEYYTLAYIGIGDAAFFKQIATQMGFPAILTVNNTAKEIRRALQIVSMSVPKLSQGTVTSSNTGFFNP